MLDKNQRFLSIIAIKLFAMSIISRSEIMTFADNL